VKWQIEAVHENNIAILWRVRTIVFNIDMEPAIGSWDHQSILHRPELTGFPAAKNVNTTIGSDDTETIDDLHQRSIADSVDIDHSDRVRVCVQRTGDQSFRTKTKETIQVLDI
jgi:hypothetical protein